MVKGLGGFSKKKLDSAATGIAYKVGSTAGGLMAVGKSKSDLPEQWHEVGKSSYMPHLTSPDSGHERDVRWAPALHESASPNTNTNEVRPTYKTLTMEEELR